MKRFAIQRVILVAWLGLGAGCGGSDRAPSATPPAPAPAEAEAAAPAAPSAPAAPAAPAAQAESAPCREYQTLLVRLGSEGGAALPGLPAQALLSFRFDQLSVVAGSLPLPDTDEDALDAALVLGSPSRHPRGSGAPARGAQTFVYLAADPGVPAADLKKARAALPRATQLRLLVLRSPDELFEQLRHILPRTPASLRERMGRPLHLDEHMRDLAQLSRPCPLADAFGSISRGGGVDILAPAVAKGLAQCRCDLVDLDAFVSLLVFAALPLPDGGYLVVDERVFAGLAANATVADVAAALARPSK